MFAFRVQSIQIGESMNCDGIFPFTVRTLCGHTTTNPLGLIILGDFCVSNWWYGSANFTAPTGCLLIVKIHE